MRRPPPLLSGGVFEVAAQVLRTRESGRWDSNPRAWEAGEGFPWAPVGASKRRSRAKRLPWAPARSATSRATDGATSRPATATRAAPTERGFAVFC